MVLPASAAGAWKSGAASPGFSAAWAPAARASRANVRRVFFMAILVELRAERWAAPETARAGDVAAARSRWHRRPLGGPTKCTRVQRGANGRGACSWQWLVGVVAVV